MEETQRAANDIGGDDARDARHRQSQTIIRATSSEDRQIWTAYPVK
jgi:hypothetical protein